MDQGTFTPRHAVLGGVGSYPAWDSMGGGDMDQGTFTPRHAVLGGVGSYPAWNSIGGGGEYGSGHFYP